MKTAIFVFLCLANCLFSCQNSKIHIAKTERKPVIAPKEKAIYNIFLVGDAGKAQANEPTLRALKEKLEQSDKNSAVVFLGDNIYPFGLPDSLHPNRKEAETYLLRQLQAVENFAGKPFFIAGNHDWNMSLAGGMAAVLRQEKFVEQYLNRGNTFLPDSACPDAKEILLTDSLVLLALDTEWWFHKHAKPQGKTSHCSSKDAQEFLDNVQKMVQRNKGKKIVVVAHHPIFSNSRHFTWKSHLFPLTDFNTKWWLPLPVLGSLYVGYRKLGFSRHDLMHKNAKLLRKGLLNAFGNTPLIYAAGHDHNLQLHQKGKQYFVVSGSGSKLRAVPKKHKALFVANLKGFAVLRFYENSAPLIEYFDEKGKSIFCRQVNY